MSNTDLTDGVLVVTGGSRGIGAATCVTAAELGYTVVVNYVSNEQAAVEVVNIESAGGRAYAVQADAGSGADIVRLFETASSYKQLTGVVNNAGITGRRCLIEEVDAQTLDRVFSVNISGYFLARARPSNTCRPNTGGVAVLWSTFRPSRHESQTRLIGCITAHQKAPWTLLLEASL